MWGLERASWISDAEVPEKGMLAGIVAARRLLRVYIVLTTPNKQMSNRTPPSKVQMHPHWIKLLKTASVAAKQGK